MSFQNNFFMQLIDTVLRRVLHWRVPSYIFLVTIFILTGSLWYVKATQSNRNNVNAFDNGSASQKPAVSSPLPVKYYRNNDFEFTKPLRIAETTSTPANLTNLKEEITKKIQTDINLGNTLQASVYFRKLNEPGAVSINSGEKYNPGSMMKIPVMLTCLKESMSDKSLLQRKILFPGHNNALPIEYGANPVLTNGHSYTIKELIGFMIIDSDNDAMGLLYEFLGQERLNKVFKELGIMIPDYSKPSFEMDPVEFSRFMYVLYNSTYLDPEHSEFALETLSKAKYNKSVTRTIPKDVHVAHKYGVAYSNQIKYLSESAIVFLYGQPYILVVMTKGNDYDRQSDVISGISEMTYNSLTNHNIN